MVDQEIFSRRLEALHGYLVKLTAFLDVEEEEFVREAALHDLAERYLHLAVEACLDLSNHYTFTILEQAGELPAELAENLRSWAGFRNILVHEYLDVDHAIAYRAICSELGDLESLASWAAGKISSA